MKNIFVWGTFDILHDGHIALLKEASSLGDLYVIVIPDVRMNGVKPLYFTQDKRVENLKKLDYIKEVIVDSFPDIKCFLKIRPDIFMLGYDQESEWEEILREFLEENYPRCEIVRSKKYGEVHSSHIKKNIKCHCGSGKLFLRCHGK